MTEGRIQPHDLNRTKKTIETCTSSSRSRERDGQKRIGKTVHVQSMPLCTEYRDLNARGQVSSGDPSPWDA